MNSKQFKTGVCSISFRKLTISDLVDLVLEAGLEAIEWGGDVHVPAGQLDVAREAKTLTLAAGLKTCAYGSYFRGVDKDGVEDDFEPVLATTLELGTDMVRIWAGQTESAVAEGALRQRLVERIRSATSAAEEEGVKVALEFHPFTLTDSNESTLRLIEEVEHNNLYMYWQPPFWIQDKKYHLAGLRALSDRILNLHVFNWGFDPSAGGIYQGILQRPLPEGENNWREYLSVKLSDEHPHYALIEHPSGISREDFLVDASSLKSWVE